MSTALANYDAPDFRRVPRLALTAGVAGVALCLVALFWNPSIFYRAYLMAYMFWFNIALGSLLLLMVQHLTGGAWGLVIRRALESGVKTLPLMAVLFVPIIIGMLSKGADHHPVLYEWADMEAAKKDPVLSQKMLWLNPTGFVLRAAIYFTIWIILGWLLTGWSLDHDKTGDNRLIGKMARLSGPGVVIYALTITFAAVDWLMSLEPHWYSTIYGATIGIGQLLGALAFMIAVVIILSRFKPMSSVINTGHLHDLGKLLFGFVMFWAYLNFSQLLITWSANLAEEAPWYLKRFHGGYQYVGILLVVLHFALPFLLLLSRDLKRNPNTLLILAVWMVFIRVIDLYYLINPTAHGEHGHGPDLNPAHLWVDLVCLIAVGGLWLAAFIMQLKKRPLIPANDPNLKEALEYHGGH